ncbi:MULTISPECIES: lactonase family protein [unclassified Bifidobacterium]|uniref:lactonase family protein n=2 Tax=Bifidobacterium TaxID=1678 RepID=UPI0021598D7C|nr:MULTISPECIES: lactonase family protein [unclassified Bifidobacterium]
MAHDVDDMDTRNGDMTLAVGGFGALRGSSCPGIEALTLHTSIDDDGMTQAVSLHKEGVLADVPSPTWITRDGDTLYAVLEDTNEVASFRIDWDGGTVSDADTVDTDTVAGPRTTALSLTELSRVPTPGSSPTHAAVAVDDLGGKHLIVANYADGHVCVHPIAADGSVLEATQVLAGKGRGPLPAQEGPHAHWILPLQDGHVLSTDLGADRIYVHRWEHGRLERTGEVPMASGTGPRDLHLLPVPGAADAAANGSDWRVAVVGEWANTVTLLGSENATGALDTNDDTASIKVLQTVDLGGDPLDQAASLAFVPWSALRRGESDGDADGNASGSGDGDDNKHDAGNAAVAAAVHDISQHNDISGIAYVGLRGSERIVALAWDGERLSRLAPEDEPGWRGRGVDCGGSRPRHILPVGNLLLVANEVSNGLTVFHLASDGEPTRVAALPSGSPTVFVCL